MHQSSSVSRFPTSRTAHAQHADRFGQLRWFLLVALAFAVVFAGVGHAYAQSAAASAYDAKFARGHILVGKKAGSTRAEFESVMKAAGGESLGTLDNIAIDVVSVPAGKEKDYVARLKANPHVEFAEVDQVMAPAASVSDPSVGSEWHIATIHAPAAWNYTFGSGVTIAILDTGVDGTHPDLAASMVAGWNFYDNNSNAADINGHGTAVAGAAAATANNGIGVAGVAGGARIMPLRISDATGYAMWSTAATAINYAADHGARVVSMSYVGAAGSSTMQSAANYLRSKGGVLFVAAGNTGAQDNTASTNSMTVVGATMSDDTIASFSTFGNFVTLSAPGYNILTTSTGGGYGYWWGTSLATPVAAGVAALVIAKRPDYTPAQVDSTLQQSAVDLGAPGKDMYFGAGRVDAGAALALASGGATPPPPPPPAGDATPPSVTLVSPASGATVAGTVAVTVTAADNVGVARVDYSFGGTKVGSSAAAPFTFSWNTTSVANTSGMMVATAYDAAGNSASSNYAFVTVNNTTAPPPPPAGDTTAPTITLVSPASGATLSGTVSIAVNASDNVGVTRVDYSFGGINIGTSSTAPFTLSWNTSLLGNVAGMLVATAYDAAGNSASSNYAFLTLTGVLAPPADTTAPTVSITSPASGATVTGTVTVAASASDNVGVTRVEFRVNGATVATVNAAPYQFSWTTTSMANGAATLTAVAYDAAGNSKTSSSVSVNVSNALSPPAGGDVTPPTVTITNPANGALVSTSIAIKATATDNYGVAGITQKLYIDGVLKATATGGTLAFTWNPKRATIGVHTIVVTATDKAGNATTRQVQVTRK